MQSFRTKIDPRRAAFLSLSAQIEGQLREAYDQRYKAGEATQASLAEKLGVNRSAVHRRLTGRTNMTIETIADMVWALGYAITVDIYDPFTVGDSNHRPASGNDSSRVPGIPALVGKSSVPIPGNRDGVGVPLPLKISAA